LRVFAASSDGFLRYGTICVRCALGRNGVLSADMKQEGDGASPIGAWPIRRVLWRADKVAAPVTAFPLSQIQRADGWCDAPYDPRYNQPVTHPYRASAEHLWREDDVYDVIVVLGYNDDPVVAGKGSAIFLHVARPDYSPTAGCVALALSDLLTLLAVASAGDMVSIDWG
jgi:L,D-peptidoglycan transpeptidase YkuD (ErfK/YbiS/YcfS/YnhG family)